MIKNFRHACIVVGDLRRSLRFYRDTLGLKVDKALTLKGQYPETVLNTKGIKLTYVKLRSPNQPKKSAPVFELHCWQRPKISAQKGYNHISFTVGNLDKEYKRLRRLEVRFLSEPTQAPDGKTKICFAYDPDNNLIEFVEDL
ncbi:MAG: VOC family protein [Candidatus Omnitrophota bacterium]